jgi:hypothetical protein
MDKKIGNDAGYFGEKLQEARSTLLKEWGNVSKSIRPDAPSSDIFGAIALASQILQNNKNTSKLLIILSDMRQNALNFDFERPPVIDISLLERTEKKGLIPDLKGVKVFVFGVHAIGKSAVYWESIRRYWQMYFKKAGADLITFTMERRFSYE